MIETNWRQRLRAAIAKRCEEPNVNYVTLAAEANKGLNFVQQYVSTERVPSVENLLILARILRVSPVYLLIGVDITPEEEEFLQLVSKLPASGRTHLRKMLEGLMRPANKPKDQLDPSD